MTNKIYSQGISINVVQHQYRDHAPDTEEDVAEEMERLQQQQQALREVQSATEIQSEKRKAPIRGRRGPRGGVYEPFPVKLHRMLENVDADGMDSIVSWQPHGRAFAVHKPKEFVEKVLPFYFRQTKITSFQRQLNLYGFSRLTQGLDTGSYYHELFLRGKNFLCKLMLRSTVKRNPQKISGTTQIEPNFYRMKPVEEAVGQPDLQISSPEGMLSTPECPPTPDLISVVSDEEASTDVSQLCGTTGPFSGSNVSCNPFTALSMPETEAPPRRRRSRCSMCCKCKTARLRLAHFQSGLGASSLSGEEEVNNTASALGPTLVEDVEFDAMFCNSLDDQEGAYSDEFEKDLLRLVEIIGS